MGDGVGSGGEDSCVRGVGEGLHRAHGYYSQYLDQSTGLDDLSIPLAVKAAPKENVFSESSGEDPGVLGGVGDTPTTHVHRTVQWLQLS